MTENGTTGEPFATTQSCVFYVSGGRVVLDYVATGARTQWTIGSGGSLSLAAGARTLVYQRTVAE